MFNIKITFLSHFNGPLYNFYCDIVMLVPREDLFSLRFVRLVRVVMRGSVSNERPLRVSCREQKC